MARTERAAFYARLPLDLDRWIEAEAAANHRSKNAEIIVKLEAARAAEQPSRPAPAGGATAAGPSLEA